MLKCLGQSTKYITISCTLSKPNWVTETFTDEQWTLCSTQITNVYSRFKTRFNRYRGFTNLRPELSNIMLVTALLPCALLYSNTCWPVSISHTFIIWNICNIVYPRPLSSEIFAILYYVGISHTFIIWNICNIVQCTSNISTMNNTCLLYTSPSPRD